MHRRHPISVSFFLPGERNFGLSVLGPRKCPKYPTPLSEEMDTLDIAILDRRLDPSDEDNAPEPDIYEGPQVGKHIDTYVTFE
jgi:hypothetical protein